jgi:hypothetical protein
MSDLVEAYWRRHPGLKERVYERLGWRDQPPGSGDPGGAIMTDQNGDVWVPDPDHGGGELWLIRADVLVRDPADRIGLPLSGRFVFYFDDFRPAPTDRRHVALH